MRGRVDPQAKMFAYVDLEARVSQNHPLRRIKVFADTALSGMDSSLTSLYKPLGRESIPPEQLLKASLLQIIYGIRSERQLVERIDDNNFLVSQHFFALRLTKDDLVQVLRGLQNASVVTDPSNPQIVRNGGPKDVQQQVQSLGRKSSSHTATHAMLSTGVELISKPSQLQVPPWQMVSSILGGVPLRAATWWANPKIPTTTSTTEIACWDSTLDKPGAVEIATSGNWDSTEFGLKGGPSGNSNHAKIGVSIDSTHTYTIFGDMNQQGTLSGSKCNSSQNGRGGLFYVASNPTLHNGLRDLISGETADP